MVLHYGGRPEDFLLAHALAIPPGIEDLSAARALVAMTLDGYLNSLERKEPFGTMSATPTAELVLHYGAPGSALPDTLRRLFMLNPLPGREKAKREKPPSPKELAKIEPGSDPASWLPKVRAIVSAGTLESAKEFSLAARLLQHSTEAEDLLVAHLMALAAAFEEKQGGLRLAAETFDRYLLAIGQKQLFDTVKNAEAKPSEPRAPAPEVVLRGFGLLAPAAGK